MKLNVAVVQHACGIDTSKNIELDSKWIKHAAKQDADLVLLPELSTSPYFCITQDPANFDLAESIPGNTSDRFSEIAKANNVVIVTTIFEKRTKGLYHNTAVVFDKDGSIAGTYRKMHIPDDPGFYEKYYFTPGEEGFKPIDTSIGKLGVLICWDQWYPEAARLMALAGAEILLFPSAIGWEPEETEQEKQRQRDAWMTIQQGHAIANNLPVMVSNRIGLEEINNHEKQTTLFWGSSFIAGQQGELLAAADTDGEGIIIADIDLERTEQVRRIWPYFRDRRIDQYNDILKRHIDTDE